HIEDDEFHIRHENLPNHELKRPNVMPARDFSRDSGSFKVPGFIPAGFMNFARGVHVVFAADGMQCYNPNRELSPG
ncbi:MAG: hypothetical protein ABFD98_19975, partial [Syntrophobacteraceae bacterium]